MGERSCITLNYPCAGWIAPRTDAKAVARLFTSSWMNLLLLAVPFGWIAYFLHWNPIAIFVLVSPMMPMVSHVFMHSMPSNLLAFLKAVSGKGMHLSVATLYDSFLMKPQSA